MKSEMAERRKIWEDTVAKQHLELSGADYNGYLCKLAEGKDHCSQSPGPVTIWSGLVAARLVAARAIGEGLKGGSSPTLI